MNTTAMKRRKVLAVLAGGVVLGVGAAVTLAAWNDSEFATGVFGAGSFNIEGSTTSSSDGFSDHPDSEPEGPADLSFALPLDVAGNMAPENTVYAPFWVRLDAATTTQGTLSLADAVGTGANAGHLAYEIRIIDPEATCDADSASETLLASGDNLSVVSEDGSAVALDIGAGSAPGAAVQLCFAVTAGPGLLQGQGATGVWQFVAESD